MYGSWGGDKQIRTAVMGSPMTSICASLSTQVVIGQSRNYADSC